ncbi:ribonuclease H-like domain-containing protein [Tanacetum coccineum]|uniref:Ribonuclease H-like domain-containing protein n=1 Tax=Tanacetum coccineum TaxID=301880 RepID=A0ABQ5DCJ7_9ASTR
MVTRSQRGIVKPLERLSLHTSYVSPIPKSPFLALKDPNWCNAMYDEYNALVKNGTWILVPRPTDANLVRSMWLFKHKFHVYGTLSRYKARLVANGSSQQLGVDFDETFSPVVKPTTIRTVLSLVVSRQWPIHQLDVKNAFLNDDLSEKVYMHQPPGFVDSRYPNHIVDSLHKDFDMTDLGTLNYFLSISTVRHPIGLFLSQKKYALQLLERAHMVNCNPSRTPVDTDSKLVQQVCLYMHDLREPHLAALKRILRYVQGTLELGLHLYASATTSLVGYTDADWAGCPSTRSAEAEYRGVANVVIETAWIRNLLRELHSPLLTPTLVYCDNAGHVRVLHVPSRFQYADIFTKGLPSALFEDFRSSLSVCPPPAHTAGEYYSFKTVKVDMAGEMSVRSPEVPIALGLSALALFCSRVVVTLKQTDKDLTVASKLGSTSLEASFSRPVRDGVERQQLLDLNLLTGLILLSSPKDRWICDLSGDGEFRVKDTRIKLDDVFLPSDSIETRWVKYIPIKINVFAWRVRLDRLPTRINLIRRGVVLESPLCPMCGLIPKDIHHVIFRCDIAQAVFSRICRWWDLDWHDLSSFSDWSLNEQSFSELPSSARPESMRKTQPFSEAALSE